MTRMDVPAAANLAEAYCELGELDKTPFCRLCVRLEELRTRFHLRCIRWDRWPGNAVIRRSTTLFHGFGLWQTKRRNSSRAYALRALGQVLLDDGETKSAEAISTMPANSLSNSN